MTPLTTLVLALATTLPTATPQGLPVILDFNASWCGPCQQMRSTMKLLAEKGYPVKPVDLDANPDLAQRYNVEEVPTFIVVAPGGRELARTKGVRPAAELAQLYTAARAKYESLAQTELPPEETEEVAVAPQEPIDEEDLPQNARPKPWETVVRIKIFAPRSVGFGSGTVIRSTPEESIILTCAHIFKIDGARQQPHPSRYPLKIQVDLFDGKLHGLRPAQVHPIESLEGEAIDYDFAADIGLIRIRPGRKLPATPVVPPSWTPELNMPMITVGCSEGNDATAWSTHITNPAVQGLVGNARYEAIQCNHAPKQGRSGGGLYTTDGFLAGVCDFAEPRGRQGLYAAPQAIHRMLDKNDLTICYNPSAPSPEMLMAARNGNGQGARGSNRSATPRPAAPALAAAGTSAPSPGRTKLRAQNENLPGTSSAIPMPAPEQVIGPLSPLPAADSVNVAAAPAGGDPWQAPVGSRPPAGGDGASLLANAQSSPSPAPVPAAPTVPSPEAAPGPRTVNLQMDPAVTDPPPTPVATPAIDTATSPLPSSRRPDTESSSAWRAVRRQPAATASN